MEKEIVYKIVFILAIIGIKIYFADYFGSMQNISAGLGMVRI